MLVPIVNEQDEIIDYKKRDSLTKDDIYRVAAAIITNKEWKILIAQRWLQKKNNPWQWTVSVAWTIEKDESYDDNIRKEIFEELWLSEVELKPLWKKRVQKSTQYFRQMYLWIITWDETITIGYPEVNDVKWVSKRELTEFAKTNNISNTLFEIVEEFKIL